VDAEFGWPAGCSPERHGLSRGLHRFETGTGGPRLLPADSGPSGLLRQRGAPAARQRLSLALSPGVGVGGEPADDHRPRGHRGGREQRRVRQPAAGLRGPPQPQGRVRRYHDDREPRVLLRRQRCRPDLPGWRHARGPLLQAHPRALRWRGHAAGARGLPHAVRGLRGGGGARRQDGLAGRCGVGSAHPGQDGADGQ
jgi:hypothetical protein